MSNAFSFFSIFELAPWFIKLQSCFVVSERERKNLAGPHARMDTDAKVLPHFVS